MLFLNEQTEIKRHTLSEDIDLVNTIFEYNSISEEVIRAESGLLESVDSDSKLKQFAAKAKTFILKIVENIKVLVYKAIRYVKTKIRGDKEIKLPVIVIDIGNDIVDAFMVLNHAYENTSIFISSSAEEIYGDKIKDIISGIEENISKYHDSKNATDVTNATYINDIINEFDEIVKGLSAKLYKYTDYDNMKENEAVNRKYLISILSKLNSLTNQFFILLTKSM